MDNQLEGKNPIYECLTRNKRAVHHVWVDERAKPERRLDAILGIARKRGIPVEAVPRQSLDKRAEGRVHNGIIARVEPPRTWKTTDLLESVAGRDPFFVLCDELAYEHNLGAILRSALGFGVDGLFLPTRRGADLSPVVQRVAMGAVEDVPIVRESPYAALKLIKKAGIPIWGADMGGKPADAVDLSGPIALVMGAEGRGLSDGIKERCDGIVSIPLDGGLESLNVSVAAALLMYEKRRQDRARRG
ncbi:MAG: 23S rRNA (guanosine(2251)-2'-O)-methyltransferase RlmB [Alphaproteobacteria bacterium]|nr:23S rRNA (guanosine(2251)-2'-O)-methyltransferase RlmB [Alphaproteobacteria bacterium]